jgi:glycosyltransferase involved in cell wall biosynthesis
MARGRGAPVVITSHGPAEGEWREYLQSVSGGAALVAISHAQTALAPEVPWRAVVHNALDTSEVPLVTDKEDHLVWLGRMSPQKGAHLAIDLARQAGRKIVLAAKCSEPAERAYFEEFVKPRLGADVEWQGEVGPKEKYELLGAAAGFLFPLQWDEPFGMVLIEAMACGTPVLTLNRGVVPEIVSDGETGFVRDRAEELLPLIDRLPSIDPRACRARVEERFGPDVMVCGYERLYQELVAESEGRPTAARRAADPARR